MWIPIPALVLDSRIYRNAAPTYPQRACSSSHVRYSGNIEHWPRNEEHIEVRAERAILRTETRSI